MQEMVLSPCNGIVVKIRILEDQAQKRCSIFIKIRQKDGAFLEIKKKYHGKISSVEIKEGEEVVKGMVLAYVEEYAYEV